MHKALGNVLETVRVDDYVEYFIFPLLSEVIDNIDDPADRVKRLDEVMATILVECNAVVNELVEERNYIWHKDEFQLEIRTGTKKERMLSGQTKHKTDEVLPPHLYGVTHYGENISDEWFIVYLLYELTRKIPGLIGRVVDSDGEFPLIEAADLLPKWANPESCAQRVYIVDGFLQLVQSSPCNTVRLLEVPAALNKIFLNPTLYRVSNGIQKCILNRLEEFKVPNINLHRQIVRLPLGVAALLKQQPELIAPAAKAFCNRDSMDLKACRSMRFFPPEQCVRTNVCFTRCLYAMLTHSNYVPDRKTGWNLSNETNTEAYKEDLIGIKVACGFEILASRGKEAEDEREWLAYLNRLTTLGYFNKNLEGSEEYTRLLAEARKYFDHNQQRYRTQPRVGKQILDLIDGNDLKVEELYDEENNLQPSESDDWLTITSEELDAILIEKYGTGNLYKNDSDMSAAEFTKRLSEFLEKESEFDGIENDDTESESSKDKFPKQKTAQENSTKNHAAAQKQQTKLESTEDDGHIHVRNFLDFVIPEDTWDSNSGMSDYEDEEDLERNFESMTKTSKNMNIDIKTYMDEMDKELGKTAVGQTFKNQSSVGTSQTPVSVAEDDFNDIETFEPVNINVNTLKNMMDSYQSQVGGAGPVSNLLSAMGAGMSVAAISEEKDKTEQGKKEKHKEKANDLSESTV